MMYASGFMKGHLPTIDRVPISSKARVAAVEVHDVRFPTSAALDGSDAMKPSPDYAAAYVVLPPDAAEGLAGHGFTFTIGAGNDVQRLWRLFTGGSSGIGLATATLIQNPGARAALIQLTR
jgi:hypothetical protein